MDLLKIAQEVARDRNTMEHKVKHYGSIGGLAGMLPGAVLAGVGMWKGQWGKTLMGLGLSSVGGHIGSQYGVVHGAKKGLAAEGLTDKISPEEWGAYQQAIQNENLLGGVPRAGSAAQRAADNIRAR